MSSPGLAAAESSPVTVVPPRVGTRSEENLAWANMSVADRAARVGRLRHLLAEQPRNFIDAIDLPWRRDAAETITAEIFPLAEACKFLERDAARILQPRKLGSRLRPTWLWGVSSAVYREPFGTILIIGPGNYPLMLPGIQIVQALVAGNKVLFKPAPGCSAIARELGDALFACGVPGDALRILDESPAAAQAVLHRVDKVVLTGSEETGRSILRELAEHLTPSVMELSGCDAVHILQDADLDLAIKCLVFGLSLNGSATCMAPRRIFVNKRIADDFAGKLAKALESVATTAIGLKTANRLNDLGSQALAEGGKLIRGRLPENESNAMPIAPLLFDQMNPTMRLLQEDVMAPVGSIVRVDSDHAGLIASRACGYRLGTVIFGPLAAAERFAAQVDAGCVIINDMIVPSADPRIPFGGRGRSGFGVTRGAEGLLEMTRAKTVLMRRGGPMPYLQPPAPNSENVLLEFLRMSHSASLRDRLRAMLRIGRLGKKSPSSK